MRGVLGGTLDDDATDGSALHFFFRYSRTRMSSASMVPKALSSANQREGQLRVTADGTQWGEFLDPS